MLPPLNPGQPNDIEARGFIAPYIRVAMHLGYTVAWVALASDEEWATPDDSNSATRQKVIDDLLETEAHLIINDGLVPDAFVNQTMVDTMGALREQIGSLITNMPEGRVDTLVEIQTLGDNLAFAGAQFERHTTGSGIADEGTRA
jgi:hypothetical protein